MPSTQDTDADAGAASLPAGDWRVLAADSELGFVARIMFGLIPVRGRYSSYEGELHIDAAGGATGSLRVAAASISTGIKMRDAHLRSNDFFAAEEHPHFSFELAALSPDVGGARTATGTLHVRDQELPVDAPVTITQSAPDSLRIAGEFDVDHGASGLGWKKVPGTVRVSAALALERV